MERQAEDVHADIDGVFAPLLERKTIRWRRTRPATDRGSGMAEGVLSSTAAGQHGDGPRRHRGPVRLCYVSTPQNGSSALERSPAEAT
jgi:hypothetical protein